MTVGRPTIDPSWMDEGDEAELGKHGSPPAASAVPSTTPLPPSVSPIDTTQGKPPATPTASPSSPASDDPLVAIRQTIAAQPIQATSALAAGPPSTSSAPPSPPKSPSATLRTGSPSSTSNTPGVPPSQTPTPTGPSVPRLPQIDTGPDLASPPTHLPAWAASVGWLVGLIVVVLGLFLASEAGWISLGLESLWGISNNPRVASAAAGAALAKTTQYRVDGQATVTLAAQSGTKPSLGLQFTELLAGKLSSVSMSWTVSPGVSSPLLGSQLANGGTATVNAVTNGQDLYIQLASGNATKWTKAESSELQAFGVQPLEWANLVEAAGGALQHGRRLPGKTINGVRTKGYELQVPASSLSATFIPIAKTLGGSLTVQVWIGTHDKRPYLMTVNGSVGSATLTSRIVFSAYDQAQTVVVPKPGEATADALNHWVESNNLLKANSATSRDAQRKADLERIHEALRSYAQGQTPFAYPKTAGVVRLDQASTVQTALKPYLDPPPTDPTAGRYYGYSSDGSTFKLTAVLENANDPQGTKQGDLTLYKVTP